MAGGPGDRDRPILQRLSERLDRTAPELGELVEEQDPVVGQRDLAGAGRSAAADQRRRGDGVVRGAERPLAHQSAGAETDRRVDLGGLERLVARERRQDGRNPAREHGLADPGRPDHEEVVPAGDRDLERHARGLLTPDVAHVGGGPRRIDRCVRRRLHAVERAPPLHRLEHLPEVRCGEDLDAGHLGRLCRGLDREQDAAHPSLAREQRRGEGAADRPRTATAIGRSKDAPSLRRSAGARFTVIFFRGRLRPTCSSAERMRTAPSRTEVAGRPTT